MTVEKADKTPVNTDCKWGPLRAPCCQKAANPKTFLACIASAMIVQGMMVNGFVNVSLTSLEKRFNLSSTDTGLIAAMYDIFNVLCLLPVGYFGGQGSKPRWVGIGMLILAVGSFVYSLPHFLTGQYRFNEAHEDEFCGAATSNSSFSSSCNGDDSLSNYKYILMLGQALNGIGAAPLFTLAINYLDEGLTPGNSALYLGFLLMLAIAGPALGFILGGFFVGLYTDFDTLDANKIDIDEESEAWVGAWWVGPLLSSILAVLVAIPILGFPERLPGWEKLEGLRTTEVHKGADDVIPRQSGIKSIRDLPKALRVLLTNLTFMFVSFGGASDAFIILGLSTFGPKLIEVQFQKSASTASLVTGILVISMSAGGSLVTGIIIKKAKLQMKGILRYLTIVSMIVVLTVLCLLMHCDRLDFAGVTVHYGTGKELSSFSAKENEDLASACNSNCSCAFDNYSPVCGDDVTYLNPCAAGCPTEAENEVHFNCSCIIGGQAKEGICSSNCSDTLFFIFVPIFAAVLCFMLISLVAIMPATLRCTPEAQRPLALCVQDIIIRPLGAVPGPLVLGALLDRSCLFWLTPSCSDNAACYQYENSQVAYTLMGSAMAAKIVGTVFYLLALWVYRPPPSQHPPKAENCHPTAQPKDSNSAAENGRHKKDTPKGSFNK